MLRLTKSDVFLLRTGDDPPSKQVGERKLKDLKSKLSYNSVMIDGIEFFKRSLGIKCYTTKRMLQWHMSLNGNFLRNWPFVRFFRQHSPVCLENLIKNRVVNISNQNKEKSIQKLSLLPIFKSICKNVPSFDKKHNLKMQSVLRRLEKTEGGCIEFHFHVEMHFQDESFPSSCDRSSRHQKLKHPRQVSPRSRVNVRVPFSKAPPGALNW